MNILKYLIKYQDELPFEKLILFVPPNKFKSIEAKYNSKDIDYITYNNLNKISQKDIIHIPMSPLIMPNYKFYLQLYARFKKIKLILNYHGDTRKETTYRLHEKKLNFFYIPSYIALPYLLKGCDKLVLNSYMFSNHVRSKYGLKNDFVIPNAIEDWWLNEFNFEKNIKLDGEINLFYHGRLVSEKGVDILLKGFAAATEKNPRTILYIAGDGPQKYYLMQLCEKFKIKNRVVFLGNLNPLEIKSYLACVDGAIYPSRWDNFAVAILEGFASANCPVYYSPNAGISDFISQTQIKLFKIKDLSPKSIYEIISDIEQKIYDKALILKQKEFAKKFTWDNVIKQYIQLYNDLCNGD